MKVIFITARIRRMTGGYIFTLSTLAGGGKGTPSQVWVGGGYPISGLGRGYPISGLGGIPSQIRGVPHQRSGWWGVPGVPQQGLDGGGYDRYPQPGLDGGGTQGTPQPATRSGWGTP